MSTHITTHRVLCIPELLDMVFGFLDFSSNVVNVQVCRAWNDVALDVLWKDVRNPRRLLEILAPLKEQTKNELEFERPLDAEDWKRFDKYGVRVRRLRFIASPRYKILESVFNDIARTRRRLDILPNLHTLEWFDSRVNLSVLFLHSGIRRLGVYIPVEMAVPTSQSIMHPFFQDLADRLPNLIHLDIRSIVPVRNIEEDLIKLLKQLPKLQKIVFPRFYTTTRIMETLSRIEYLSIIEFQYDDQGCGDSSDVISFNPTFTEGAFPALYDLSMTIYFDDAARFLNSSFAPANLTMIYISSETTIEFPDDVSTLLSAMAENCHLLTHVGLWSIRNSSLEGDVDPDAQPVTFNSLKPLLKLPNLVNFEIQHHYPLQLSQQDVEELASSCPSIETLLLNPDPVILEASTLTLEALLPFAKYCPRLVDLGLFVDAAADVADVSAVSPPKPFTNLSKLSMGISIVDEDSTPALYLSQLLPPTTTIDCGITWDDRDDLPEALADIVKERCQVWDRIAKTVPMLSALRKQERQRTFAMERELEDLRMRTEVMRNSMAIGVKLDLSTCVLI